MDSAQFYDIMRLVILDLSYWLSIWAFSFEVSTKRGFGMTDHGMIRSRQGSFDFIYRFVDISVICSFLFIAAFLYGTPFTLLYSTTALIACSVFTIAGESLGVYRSWRASTATRMLLTTAGVWSTTVVIVLTLGFFAKVSESFSRVVMGSWFVATLFGLMFWRLVLRQILRYMRCKGYNSRTAAIIGIGESGMRLHDQIIKNPDIGIRFKGFYEDADSVVDSVGSDISIEGSINDVIARANAGEFDLVFIALPFSEQNRISEILERFGDTTVDVHLIPDLFTFNLMSARIGAVGSVQTLSVFETPIFGFNDLLKRGFDVVFSLVALVLISLPMLVIAAAVKLTSPGPIIFKQIRYGLDGKKILVWKFRSMTSMDNGDKVVQAKKGDARITKVGAFIRKTSLDELPQFINVLQGHMSVVGPRPHAVAHNEEYRKVIPYYMLRHKVKPGITGWAQINGYRGETDTLDKMQGRVDYDLEYIRNWSLWMDIKIVFLTVFKGFVGSNVH